MNDEINGLVQEVAKALIADGKALEQRELTPHELLVLSKDLRALSRMTKHISEVARMLEQ